MPLRSRSLGNSRRIAEESDDALQPSVGSEFGEINSRHYRGPTGCHDSPRKSQKLVMGLRGTTAKANAGVLGEKRTDVRAQRGSTLERDRRWVAVPTVTCPDFAQQAIPLRALGFAPRRAVCGDPNVALGAFAWLFGDLRLEATGEK